MAHLTGPFNTGKLPRIAPGAVTVTIARKVAPEYREQFDTWCEEMMKVVRQAPGCLGATVFFPSQGEEVYHSVFRFQDAVSLRKWDKSIERREMLTKVEHMIISERVTATAGSEEFFRAQSEVEKNRGKVRKFLNDLLWVYPVGLASAVLLAPHLAKMAIWQRVLVTSLILGLTSSVALRPIRRWWRRRRMLPQNLELKNLRR
jgi:antibiotic biosynthesis monooxygenase (ABM) superfamily enzyme